MVYLSLVDWTPMRGEWWEAPFYGGMNYLNIISDTRFLWAMLRSLFYIGTSGSLEFFIGLGMALTVASFSSKRIRSGLVTAFIVPMMLIPAVVGYSFYILFFEHGAIYEIIRMMFGSSPLFMTDAAMAQIPVIFAEVWQWTPFMFLVLYSGLISLPSEPIKAARVLGASELQIFRKITIPMLKPIIVIAVLIRFLELFKLFDAPFIITHGGPGISTETISIFMYYSGFQFWQMSFIAAGATLILSLILIILITTRVARVLGY